VKRILLQKRRFETKKEVRKSFRITYCKILVSRKSVYLMFCSAQIAKI